MPTPMVPGTANPSDPYCTFMFQIVFDNRTVAGFSKMSALKRVTEFVTHRAKRGPTFLRHIPGGAKFETVTLERGLSCDPVFEAWAHAVNDVTGGNAEIGLKDVRRDVVIKVLNLHGLPTTTYTFPRALVSEFRAMPEFDANEVKAIAFESITIHYQGFTRDADTKEAAKS